MPMYDEVRGSQTKNALVDDREFIYIMGCLHDEDRDGHVVLGHEFLLLVQSQCCRKRGEAEDHVAPLHY